jgi:hypothetical protein
MLPRLEDALRCASLPDDSNRVLVVRKLALGPIRHDCSAQQLSMLIEHRVAELGAVWQDGDSAEAVTADCVQFRSALEARMVLMRRLVKGESCSAWYWPLAVKEFRRGETLHQSLRNVVFEIARWPEAPAALPAWVAAVARAGGLEHLASSFSAQEGAALLHWAGIAIRPGVRPHPVEAGAAESAVLPRHEELLERAGQGLETSPQPPWLASLLQLAGLSTQDGLPGRRGVEQGAAEASSLVPPAPHAPVPHLAQRPPINETPLEMAPAKVADSTRKPRPVGDRNPPTRVEQGLDLPHALPPRASAAVDASGTEPPANVTGLADVQAAPARLAPTQCGGLLFLLPVLQSLGLPQWCDDDEACAAMARRILAAALMRLRVPAEDVAWAITQSPVNLPVNLPAFTGIAPPTIWSDAALRAPAAQPPIALPQALLLASTADQQAQIWLAAVRRWLRRRVGLGLASLVLRPARLDCTPTHLDMHFYANDVDMRVRRAGLDIDPGWLPWFGQVVAYHYQERGV